MPRLIFLNRFFYPDHSATSQILTDLAFQLAANGRDIHVITSQQRYDTPNARLPAREIVRGVKVHRVPTTQFGRSGLIGRGLDYLSYYFSARKALIRLAERGDIVVAKTDSPLLFVLASNAAHHSGTRVVNWLQDLYPEVAVELGVPLLKGPVANIISFMRNRSLLNAHANVVLGKDMAARLCLCGVPEARISIIPNWTDDETIVPVAAESNPLRHEWGLEGKFVVGYSGNLGRAHEFETLLGAAEKLRDHPGIIFVFIGGGHQFLEIAHQVRARGLEQKFRFFPYQDRAGLQHSLSLPDVHWLSLKPQLDGLIFPSKLYGIAAAGRPIIAITSAEGEIATLVRENDCGVAIEPGNAEALAETFLGLSEDPARCAILGQNAREMLETKFSRRQAFKRWQDVIDTVGSAQE